MAMLKVVALCSRKGEGGSMVKSLASAGMAVTGAGLGVGVLARVVEPVGLAVVDDADEVLGEEIG